LVLCGRPQRLGDAGDRSDRHRPEIATVKRRWLVRVHEEDLAVADHAAAPPDRERVSAVVLLARSAPFAAVDRDDGTGTANCLPFHRKNGLEQRHAAREITALGEPRGERLRRIRHDKCGDGQIVRWAHPVEPCRDTPGDVPNEARGRSGPRGRPDRGNGHHHGHEHGGTASHDITRCRQSQA